MNTALLFLIILFVLIQISVKLFFNNIFPKLLKGEKISYIVYSLFCTLIYFIFCDSIWIAKLWQLN